MKRSRDRRAMTPHELRSFLRYLMKTMREDRCHRALRHSIERAIREFFYEGRAR